MSNVTPAGIFPELPNMDGLSRILATIGDSGFWKRFGVIAMGTGLVLVGIVILISGTRVAKETAAVVKGVASKVVTKGVV